MKHNKKIQYLFKLWLILYRIENALWQRYSLSFMRLSGGKDFPEYHYEPPYNDESLF